QKRKLEYVENDTSYTNEEKDEMKKKIEDRMKRMNEDLTVRQESIDILKGKLSNQITSIKETITKVLDKDLTLREKIKVLFREQGITVVSILTAIGMALGVLIEAILPKGAASTPHNPNKGNGNDSNNAKEFIKNKLKALANLLGRLASKAADALPGIIGAIVSFILNTAKEAVGWLSQNLWALIVGIGGLIYTYFMTKR
ncbi:MAG: hypothetical protein J4F36_14550, partial [Nitrosopumilaceae archaeon]|nr:hypothetical protein [Nitrosopumilaceae archaeon]